MPHDGGESQLQPPDGPSQAADQAEDKESWLLPAILFFVGLLAGLWLLLGNPTADNTSSDSAAHDGGIDFSDVDDSFVPPEQAMQERRRQELRDHSQVGYDERAYYRDEYLPETERARREGLDYERRPAPGQGVDDSLARELNLDQPWREGIESGRIERDLERLLPEEAREYLDQ